MSHAQLETTRVHVSLSAKIMRKAIENVPTDSTNERMICSSDADEAMARL